MDVLAQKTKELKTKAGEYMGGGGYGRTVGTSPLGGGTTSSYSGIGTALAMGGSVLLGTLANNNNKTSTTPNSSNPILDKTFENIEVPIENKQEPKTWYELMKEEQAHREQREDTAYSRAIEDLRRSGVNINLLGNINPAASSGADFSPMQTASNESIAQYQGDLELLKTYIEQDFKGDENTKDRILGLIDTIGKFYIGSKLGAKK